MLNKLINLIILFTLSFLFLAFSLPSLTQDLSSELNLKRKVAISRFSNETQSGMTFLVDDGGDRLGKQTFLALPHGESCKLHKLDQEVQIFNALKDKALDN